MQNKLTSMDIKKIPSTTNGSIVKTPIKTSRALGIQKPSTAQLNLNSRPSSPGSKPAITFGLKRPSTAIKI